MSRSGRCSCGLPGSRQLQSAVHFPTEHECHPCTEVSMFARALTAVPRSRTLLLGAAIALLAATPAASQATKHAAKQATHEKDTKLAWGKAPDMLPPGAMMAVVSGDP